jgi:hypothetical protein
VAYRRNFLASPAPIALLLGFPRYLIRQLVEQALQTAWSGSFGDELAAFKNRVRLSFLIGQAIEGRIFHKSLAFEGQAVHDDRPWSAPGGG